MGCLWGCGKFSNARMRGGVLAVDTGLSNYSFIQHKSYSSSVPEYPKCHSLCTSECIMCVMFRVGCYWTK